jgi:hypothetical protein
MTSHTMKDVAKKEVTAHEKRMHGKKKGGSVGMSKMMMEHGRGMAKVMNQKKSGRGR